MPTQFSHKRTRNQLPYLNQQTRQGLWMKADFLEGNVPIHTFQSLMYESLDPVHFISGSLF